MRHMSNDVKCLSMLILPIPVKIIILSFFKKNIHETYKKEKKTYVIRKTMEH